MSSANKGRVEIREYPDDGGAYITLVLRSHWNYKDRVVLRLDGVGNDKEYVFLIRDIEAALRAVEACKP